MRSLTLKEPFMRIFDTNIFHNRLVVLVRCQTWSSRLGRAFSQLFLLIALAGSTWAATIYGVNTNSPQQLVKFNSTSPAAVTVIGAITGLQSGEVVLGIDFRPVNRQLYALGNTSRLYTINLVTAAATSVGSGPFSPVLNGTNFGFDFNP